MRTCKHFKKSFLGPKSFRLLCFSKPEPTSRKEGWTIFAAEDRSPAAHLTCSSILADVRFLLYCKTHLILSSHCFLAKMLLDRLCAIDEPDTPSSPCFELHHPIERPCQRLPLFHHATILRATNLLVLSLYNTLCPHSLHRMGSPFFSCTFAAQSPQRY